MREVTPENAADYLRETGRVPDGRGGRGPGAGLGRLERRPPGRGRGASPRSCSSRRASGCGPRPSGSAGSTGSGPSARRWNCSARVLPEGAVPRRPLRRRGELPLRDDLRPGRRGRLEGAAPRRPGRPGGRRARRRRSSARSTPRPATTRRLDGRLADTTVFDELRIDPFYRTIARVHPEIAPPDRRADRLDGRAPATAASSSPTSARRTSWSTPGA